MKKTITLLSLVGIALLFLSSCFLFKKTQGPRLPKAPDKVEEPPQFPEEDSSKVKDENENDAEKNITEKWHDVALFVPLAVDDLMADSFEVGSRQPLPPETLNALGFYEGALMALNELRSQDISVRLHVYDSRSQQEPLPKLLKSGKVDSVDLIIGAVNGKDYKEIADFSKSRKIHFVSATYPNDGGVGENPFLIIVNSTLNIHCTAIQSFAQRKFSNKQITTIYYNNAQGRQNLNYLRQAYQKMNYGGKTPLKDFEWTNNTTIEDLISQLNKDKTNVIILTTLYPDMSLNIIAQLIPYAKAYNINVVGMPTLDGLRELKGKKYAGMNIYYGAVFPYGNLGSYPVMKSMMWDYFNRYRVRPDKEALNGYETLFYFGQLLNENPRHFNTALSRSKGKLATSYNFQPIYQGDSKKLDYYENTRIYFFVERDGEVAPAN